MPANAAATTAQACRAASSFGASRCDWMDESCFSCRPASVCIPTSRHSGGVCIPTSLPVVCVVDATVSGWNGRTLSEALWRLLSVETPLQGGRGFDADAEPEDGKLCATTFLLDCKRPLRKPCTKAATQSTTKTKLTTSMIINVVFILSLPSVVIAAA